MRAAIVRRACAARLRCAMQRPPARIGDPLAAVETPALVVDLDAFEHNLDLMANAVRGSGLALRPHAQVAQVPGHRAGAGRARRRRHLLPEGRRGGGVRRRGHRATCWSPTRSSRRRRSRGSRRSRARATVGVLVDDARVVADLSRRGDARRGGTLDVLRRDRRRRAALRRRAGRAGGGARAGDRRARRGSRFRGLHAYHGGAQHLRTPDERRAAIARGRARSRRDTKALIERAGVRVPGRHRRRHRHVAARARQPRLHRAAAGLVRLHGRRLRPQRAGARRARVRAEPVRAGDGDERADAATAPSSTRDSRRSRSIPGCRSCTARAASTYAKASDEHGVLAVDPARAPPALGDRVWLDPGPLRSDGQSVRLDRRHARRARRMRVAGRGARRAGLSRRVIEEYVRWAATTGASFVPAWSNASVALVALATFTALFVAGAFSQRRWFMDVAFLSLVVGGILVAWPAMVALSIAAVLVTVVVSFLHRAIAPRRARRSRRRPTASERRRGLRARDPGRRGRPSIDARSRSGA